MILVSQEKGVGNGTLNHNKSKMSDLDRVDCLHPVSNHALPQIFPEV